MKTSQQELVIRLNRIEGQVAALKRTLEEDAGEDCEKILFQLKAATNGLKRFGEAFAHEYTQKCIRESRSAANLQKNMNQIISTAFTLA